MRTPLLLATLILLAAVLFVPPSGATAQQREGRDEMREANRAASLLLLEKMKRDRRKDYEALCRVRRRDLLVVRGSYDHVEWVLRELKVPFAETSPESLARTDLRRARAVLVNCPGRVGSAGVRRLKDFVRAGGLLFTTDWSVLHVLEPAFPGTVRYTRKPTRDDVVPIRILKPEHVFLRHVLTGNDRHLWWLENRSYPVQVLDRRRVEVLADSEEMERKYGAKPIAVTFREGRGRVVHIVSHFYLQRSELRGDRDRLAAKAFAGDLGFAAASAPVKRLEKEGLAKVRSGELRSAYSAQQLLANILVEATRPAKPEPPDPKPPVEPPKPKPPEGAHAARATVLRDAPGGEPVKAIPADLRLRVLERRGEWIKVATPAGETGWLARDAVAE
ncbi:MAG: SH3 domain-containing protein [Planctomycetota bacterium]|jgi:hypothetical protein